MNVLAMSRQMNGVQRLAPQCEDSGNGAPAFAYMDEDPLGSFVRYTDYAEVRRLYQAEVSALQQQLAASKAEYSEAAQLCGKLADRADKAEQQLAAAREALQAAEADAARYRWLRDSPRCSLTVNHNDHHCMYQSVADTMDDTQDYYSDVPEDEKARMIATDSIWTVHEYPNTPVGFNVYHAATLDTAIDEAIATLQRDRQP